MKRMLVFFLLLSSMIGYTQKIYFPARDLTANNYPQSMSKLAAAVIPIYRNDDKAAYYNDLFRFYFAKQEFEKVIQSLDSFDIHSKLDKLYFKVPGFHYRVHSMTMLAIQKDPAKEYAKEFVLQFNGLFNSLPEAGREQASSVYEEADTEKEKVTYLEMAKNYEVSGSDSISLNNAIDFIKQWNFWQVFDKTVSLAKKQMAVTENLASVKKQNEGIKIEEGATISPNAKTIIRNVTMVDVEKQKLIPNVTVSITGNMISAISTKSSNANLPPDATIIDGAGKFLMPGMTDAHVHFSQSGGLYTRPDGINLRKYMPFEKEIEWTHVNMPDVLKRYVQSGITSVIDVGSTPNFLQLRDKFVNKTYAPAVYMTGPLITSFEPEAFKKLGNDEPFNLVKTEEEGRKMVQQQLPYHPDFIKIWYIANGNDKAEAAQKFLPVARAIIEEAHKNHLKVAVHATERITAQLAVEAGCDYLVHSVDDEVVSDDFIKLLKSRNVILCPTLVVHDGYRKTFGQELDFTSRELRLANQVQLGSLYDLKHLPEPALIGAYKNSIKTNKASASKLDSICLVNLKKMMDAGIRIAAGTDAGNIGTLHGTSLLAELNLMKRAGISNWQIIQSATINPTYILGKEKETGSIALGKKADMVLLNANPIDALDNLEQISLVINKGHLIKPDTLIRETPLALVQRQLNAYNAHNLDAFLEPYADDVELYDFPNTLVTKGKAEMRKQYTFLNNVPELHCEIKERIIQGNTIIDKESVTGFGNKPLEATAIYQIENNKIKKVFFISNR